MTIDEAIEANKDTVELLNEKGLVRKANAVQLGIEALKEVRASREEDYIGDTGLLPGETEEVK